MAVDANSVREAVIAALAAAPERALFASELAADPTLRPVPDERLRERIVELAAEGSVVVVDHAPPDPHLRGVDLRVVALAQPPEQAQPPELAGPPAIAPYEAAERIWSGWLQEFLRAHTCQ